MKWNDFHGLNNLGIIFELAKIVKKLVYNRQTLDSKVSYEGFHPNFSMFSGKSGNIIPSCKCPIYFIHNIVFRIDKIIERHKHKQKTRYKVINDQNKYWG